MSETTKPKMFDHLVPEAAPVAGATELIVIAGAAELVASVVAVSIAVAFVVGIDAVSAGASELVRSAISRVGVVGEILRRNAHDEAGAQDEPGEDDFATRHLAALCCELVAASSYTDSHQRKRKHENQF